MNRPAGESLTFLFAATLFTSAALLFWVEPMVAKMLLPFLGGTPAVWNTCLLFFQTLLLAGYAYALFASRRLSLGRQALIQIALLVVTIITLPVSISAAAAASVPREGDPSLWLMGRLFLIVGLPFFTLSTLGPLLQKWFAATGHESARDPYFLYAASNAGSLCALVGYPLALEPLIPLAGQSRLWSYVYAALVLLVAACAALAWRAGRAGATIVSPRVEEGTGDEDVRRVELSEDGAAVGVEGDANVTADGGADAAAAGGAERLTWARRLRWVLLAFAPSSLMLGVTTYLSTDIASLPLLWVVPLSLYLLTLILVFARTRPVRQRWVELALPGVALVFTLAYLSNATQPAFFLAALHLLFFFVAALACHGRLADDRPDPSRLAEFYLWMSVGGALGGLFNALVAPVVFERVAEYPLAVLLACAIFAADRSKPDAGVGRDRRRERVFDFALPAFVLGLCVLLALVVSRFEWGSLESLALVVGVPLVFVYQLRRRPARFALALGAVMLGGFFWRGFDTETLLTERNFYGTLRITRDAGEQLNWLYHGTTIHGRQSTALDRRCEPLSYYHREGPLGQLLAAYNARPSSPRVAVVGLGTGATAAYARAGQSWTFYEINPAVAEIARRPDYFTYLSYCAQGAPVDVVLGDARLRLAEAAPAAYGLVVLDAFSSDAIPVHLMTLEALDLYLSKLAPGGLLTFHISNRSLDLHTVVADLARARSLAALSLDDNKRAAGRARPPRPASICQPRRWRRRAGRRAGTRRRART
ncbi:MAG: spermidine synthase, partial [Pyrinomonadaceae bacterium]